MTSDFLSVRWHTLAISKEKSLDRANHFGSKACGVSATGTLLLGCRSNKSEREHLTNSKINVRLIHVHVVTKIIN